MLRSLITSNPKLLAAVAFFCNLLNLYRVKVSSKNNVTYNGAFLISTKIKVRNERNTIILKKGAYLRNSSINVYGNNNKVIVNEDCKLLDVEIHIEDDNNEIILGKNTTIAGSTHLACIEGTSIYIGEDCMFSKDITFRTGDSHSIVDLEGVRINPSKDIYIGDHVWVGNKVIITKGSRIPNSSIVGTGAIVGKEFVRSNVIIAGVPAKVVKENINWKRERI